MDFLIDTLNPAVADYLKQMQEWIDGAIAIVKDTQLIAKPIQTTNANGCCWEEYKYNVGLTEPKTPYQENR